MISKQFDWDIISLNPIVLCVYMCLNVHVLNASENSN